MKNFDLEAYLHDLRQLCAIDSGHGNAAGTKAMADFFKTRYDALGLKTELRYYENNSHAPVLLVSNCEPKQAQVLFASHMDTVFPVGEGAKRPLTVEGEIAKAPGCVDCKGGCLLTYYLLRSLLEQGECRFRFCAIYNSDEEMGSTYSRACFEALSKTAQYAFIMEPGRPNGEFVSMRKGGSKHLIKCHGVTAHPGVDPQKGASAILELCRWVDEIYKLTDYKSGTTVNVAHFEGGSRTGGGVPDYAECTLRMNYAQADALNKLDALFARMKNEPFDPRTSIEIVPISSRPSLVPGEKTENLLERLKTLGSELGQKVQWISTGGMSDGNFLGTSGMAVLDGCGPSGGNLHTAEEYLNTASVAQRLDILYALLTDLFPKF